MNNLTKKMTSVLLSVLFASMQVSAMDTGLGVGNGGATINNIQGGFVDMNTGSGFADLNFNGNAHVNWDSLNINNGENLNFNAVNGANNLTILNTVNHGMSNIYGQINANSGIGKLIISNPNGMLFDGAKFTTAGDLMITTKDMSMLNVNDLTNAQYTKLYDGGYLIPVNIKNSTFNVGGDYTIMAAGINAATSTINAQNVKFITANGQDYVALGATVPTKDQTVTRLKAMTINGNLYITNDVGALEILDGGTINGNTKILTQGNVVLNKENNGNQLVMNGDAEIAGNGAQMFLRNTEVKGNLAIGNGGGFLDVGDVHVTKDAKLITKDLSTNNMNGRPVKHFIHVIGDTKVDGNLTVEAKDNVHIGGYDYATQTLADGSLTVGNNLSVHSQDGHIMTTVNTSAKKISMKSDNLNVLTDDKAVLSADEYEFSSNGYIGGIGDNATFNAGERIVRIMENYIPIPQDAGTNAYMTISGGKITKLETPNAASAYIASKGNVELTGANAGQVHITAYDKNVTISGNDVHANTITVGKETDKLKVEFPSRDYKLKYTNIRDAQEVTINGNDEITYELTNGDNGYNKRDPRPNNTTYLVGPDRPVDPTPKPNPVVDDNENVKVLRSFEKPEALDAIQPSTPIAYAADLDDDEVDTGVRKNVDGSVTVVRAFPMVN